MKHNREQDIETLKQCIDFFIDNGVELLRGKEFPVDQLPDKLKLSLESKKFSNLLKKRLKNG